MSSAAPVATPSASSAPGPSPSGDHLVHLRAAGTSVVLSSQDGRLPSVLHWGPDLGAATEEDLRVLRAASVPQVVNNDVDVHLPVGLLPEMATGWRGRPGLAGHRDGAGWTPSARLTAWHVEEGPGGEGGRLVAEGEDADAGVAVRLELELLPSGLLRTRAAVRNLRDAPYVVDALAPALPVPETATEVLDLAGRWGRERAPQRAPFGVGAHSRENRRGRTGPDAPLVLAVGAEGFGFRAGEVWAVHTAWSGNHVTCAERVAEGQRLLSGGELLLPGEVRLGRGEELESPWLYAAHALDGLDGVAARFHEHLRSREQHPSSPRPVVMNVWEAVYFDHDLDRLVELARLGAEVGAERFVLDDGWFRHRRDDSAGLGDWYVDEDVWPQGLTPLVDAVRAQGMDFGLWFEPEMVNPDSDLARAHPDWLLRPEGREPLLSRRQQVLDLGHPDARAHVLERLDSLLTEYDISYVKWDHNRDLLDAGSGPVRAPGVHAQTLAVYALLDELRRRHPGVEVESCSSGGLRVDLGVLERTDRVWGSDCIDPLERQQIQRWTTQLLPPELVGSHVGSPRSHTTGRTHDLSFRAGTALFCSFGIEWDVSSATPEEREELAAWVSLYKDVRGLLHTGRTVRADAWDPAVALHGVVSQDGSDALFALVQLSTALTSVPGNVRLPGLRPDVLYRVSAQAPGDLPRVRRRRLTPWLAEGVVLPGSVLGAAGVRAPALDPEQLLLLRVQEVARGDGAQDGSGAGER
ncbi:alpha-galactosidase [Pseudokineococcus marinus]|uniref:Alpha-galactosidase n=1 Tax=Pseudokineococcus marinus TaxID=351215 RepID=A0A849BU45_9ACTN|nr:alpha-galactosidase [Pseudokineococcus marinus]NNH23036.1 alpha-galactosidase [Pseudokineococcus marinus]